MPLNFLGGRPAGPSIRHQGSPITGNFFCQSSFATYAIATARNVVRIDEGLPLEILAPLPRDGLVGYGRVVQRDEELFWSDVEIAAVSDGRLVARGTVVYRIVT